MSELNQKWIWYHQKDDENDVVVWLGSMAGINKSNMYFRNLDNLKQIRDSDIQINRYTGYYPDIKLIYCMSSECNEDFFNKNFVKIQDEEKTSKLDIIYNEIIEDYNKKYRVVKLTTEDMKQNKINFENIFNIENKKTDNNRLEKIE